MDSGLFNLDQYSSMMLDCHLPTQSWLCLWTLCHCPQQYILGNPLVSVGWSKILATWCPDKDVSTSIRKHSPLKSSMIINILNFLALSKLSWTKSILQRSLGPAETGHEDFHRDHVSSFVSVAGKGFLGYKSVHFACDWSLRTHYEAKPWDEGCHISSSRM